MCMTSGQNPSNQEDYVISGSKDYSIKVFSIGDETGGVISPSISLNPAHFDSVESMALDGDTLFSASRDTYIKKWDLKKKVMVKAISNAHKDWICGLAFLPGMTSTKTVISGCRGGQLKLWNVDTCGLLGEVNAHNAMINAITTNRHNIFTASNDGSVGIWKVRDSV